MKIEYDEADVRLFKETEEGRVYLKYNEKVGGEPIGLTVPFGYPPGVKERGGVIAVYKECIAKGVTWEKLLGYAPPPNDVLI